MPIYEYKCVDCGAQTEKRQSVSDDPLTVCENCGGKLEKQWSLSGFQFKGAGWYVTDYAGKNPDGASDGAAEKKTDSTTAASTEKTSTTESTVKTDTASNVKPASNSDSKKD